MHEVPLPGGRANYGQVVRIGDAIARPWHPQAPFVEDFLRFLQRSGIEFAPDPLGRDERGRQRLSYIDGRVPLSPYPDWAWSDDLLTDVAERQLDLHVAAASYEPPAGAEWATTAGAYFPPGSDGRLLCHNDLCMSNVVVRPDTDAVAGFIDFDYVAPTNRLFDIAVLARHWAPFGDPDGNAVTAIDRVGRFRRICEVHDLDPAERTHVVDLAASFLEQARRNVRALADGGNEGFRHMIEYGYEATNRSTVRWLTTNREALVAP